VSMRGVFSRGFGAIQGAGVRAGKSREIRRGAAASSYAA